jgi:low affinity Fe/Cu permease
MNAFFRRFSLGSANAMGSPWAFVIASLVVLVWAVSGPIFDFSDTWQLVINTGTTVLTFLAVFLIQNTQNRDAQAIHLKLDELIRGVEGARTGLVSLEEMPDEEIRELAEEFKSIHEEEQIPQVHSAAAEAHASAAAEQAEKASDHARAAKSA